MLTENSTYKELYSVLREAMSIDLYRNKRFKGQRERAMLNGEDWMHFFAKIKGECVMYICDLKNKRWRPVIYMDATEGLSFAWFGRNFNVILLRGHAIARYIQRKVYHNENMDVYEDDFFPAAFKVLYEIKTIEQSYDKIGEQLQVFFDDGAFLCSEQDKVITLGTYIPLSKMHPNQILAMHKAKKMQDEERNKVYETNIDMAIKLNEIACTKRLR